MEILSKGFDLLCEIQEGSLITEQLREKIFSNRKQELLAQHAYVRAQRRLWRFLSDADPSLAGLDNTRQQERIGYLDALVRLRAAVIDMEAGEMSAA